MSAPFRSGFLALAIALMFADAAGAQPAAASLEELKTLLSATSNVTVTNTHGQELRGTLVDASASMLALQIGREIRRLQAAEIRSVRVRQEDSLANGALIGAVVGGGLTALMFLDNECHADPVCYQAVAVYAGLGALAGLGIDALRHGHVVVYTAPPPAARQIVTIAPLVTRERKGVRLSIAF